MNSPLLNLQTRVGTLGLVIACSLVSLPSATAQVVPGTGARVENLGDDFEDPNWSYTLNLPKSSRNIDKDVRQPLGFSSNNRWFESAKRGTPDLVQRVDTPAGGLSGSTGAMLLRSRDTGVPGRPSHESQQDDFLLRGANISVNNSPSVVVRVYLPPFEEWEPYTDVSFGMRAGVRGPMTKTEAEWEKFDLELGREPERRRNRRGFFKGRLSNRPITRTEAYYPGFFIQFNSKNDPRFQEDSAVFVVRADTNGHDFLGPQIKQTGWWTLGMSFTPDGRVHYYARPGVEDLTPADHIASHLPYGTKCESFYTFFFNVCSQDNGRSWSTPWIIDDCWVYQMPAYQAASRR